MANIILKLTNERIVTRAGRHLSFVLDKPVGVYTDYVINKSTEFMRSLGLLNSVESLDNMISIIKDYHSKFTDKNTDVEDFIISVALDVPDKMVDAVYPNSIVIKFTNVNMEIERVESNGQVYVTAGIYYLTHIEELLDSLSDLIIGSIDLKDRTTYYTLQRKYMENLSGMPITKGIEQLFVENLKDKIGGSIISYNNTLGVLKDDILYTLYRIIKK